MRCHIQKKKGSQDLISAKERINGGWIEKNKSERRNKNKNHIKRRKVRRLEQIGGNGRKQRIKQRVRERVNKRERVRERVNKRERVRERVIKRWV